MVRARVLLALVVSVGLHALPLAHALTRSLAPHRLHLDEPARPEEAAVWAGETFDIDSSSASPSPSPVSRQAAAEPADAQPVDAEPADAEPADAEPVAAPTTPARSSQPSQQPPSSDVDPGDAAATRPSRPAGRAKDSSGGGASEQTASSGGSDEEPAGSTAGAYGQAGADTVSAPLGKGLLRALPRVAFVEPTFHELPTGATGRVWFTVELDAEGHPESPARFDRDRPRLLWFEPIVDRALLLLRAGTFSAPPSTSGAPQVRFEVSFEVSEGLPASGEWLEPRDLAEIGRMVEPTASRPGRAHFRYNSGREVLLVLTLVPRSAAR